MTNRSKYLALCGASVLALFAATSAGAQEYGRNDDANRSWHGPTEKVIVTAPRYRAEENGLGDSVKTVVYSREVAFDDLDLTTDGGARELRHRVRETARRVCHQLRAVHPVSFDNAPSCYTGALQDAMYQVDDAIGAARGEAQNEQQYSDNGPSYSAADEDE